jgi:RimJ/RimL family protein N-acetyltransferase
VLRRLELADLARFQAYRGDPGVGEFQGWEPQPDHEAARFIEDMSGVDLFPRGAWVQLGIADRNTNELIGDVGICVSADGEKAEIGFTVAPRAQGSGLGTEAVREVIGLIFDHTDVSRVVAVIDARNSRAHRLVLRAGFQKVESLRTVFRGKPCIEDVWAVSKADTTTEARSRLVSVQAGPGGDHVDRADESTTGDVPRVAD